MLLAVDWVRRFGLHRTLTCAHVPYRWPRSSLISTPPALAHMVNRQIATRVTALHVSLFDMRSLRREFERTPRLLVQFVACLEEELVASLKDLRPGNKIWCCH